MGFGLRPHVLRPPWTWTAGVVDCPHNLASAPGRGLVSVFLPQLTEVWQQERRVNTLSVILTRLDSDTGQRPRLRIFRASTLRCILQIFRSSGWAELHISGSSYTFLLAFSPSLIYIFFSFLKYVFFRERDRKVEEQRDRNPDWNWTGNLDPWATPAGPLSYIFCPLLPDPWGHPSGSLKSWSQALCSGEHNPSPLPCFLLIVSLLNVFGTRPLPIWKERGKEGNRKESDYLRDGAACVLPSRTG